MHATLQMTTDLGARVSAPVTLPENGNAYDREAAILSAMREYGKLGWRPTEVPGGGLVFPLANEADFDWSLIGGKLHEHPSKGAGVYWGGDFYTRRALDVNEKKNMPEKVKYSRGARAADPDGIVEVSGEFSYVTLAVFVGNGKRREKFALPTGGPAREKAAEPAAEEVAAQQSADPPEASHLVNLPESEENRRLVLSFIRDAGQATPDDRVAVIDGRSVKVKDHVLGQWDEIKDDWPKLLNAAEAMEKASGRSFTTATAAA